MDITIYRKPSSFFEREDITCVCEAAFSNVKESWMALEKMSLLLTKNNIPTNRWKWSAGTKPGMFVIRVTFTIPLIDVMDDMARNN